jgi:nicotinamide-nucleotide amidase
LLNVSEEDLEQFGAVSATVAQQMAAGVARSFGSDWGLSITGIAGPGGGTELKPVGLVYIGLAGPGGDSPAKSFEYRFGSTRSRDWIRRASASMALDKLRRQLLAIL